MLPPNEIPEQHLKNSYLMEDSQRPELEWRLRAHYFTILGILLIGGYVVLAAVLQVRENPNALFSLAIFAPITFTALLWMVYRAWQLWLDLRDGRVESIEDVVYIKKVITGKRRQSRIQVGDSYFYFASTKLPDLIHGKPYRVYYSPRSKIYLAAEPLFNWSIHDT